MTKYGNKHGNSGVQAYEIGEGFIKVQFKDATYLYTYEQTGRLHVEQMKILAISGKGLSTYISKFIRKNYTEKL